MPSYSSEMIRRFLSEASLDVSVLQRHTNAPMAQRFWILYVARGHLISGRPAEEKKKISHNIQTTNTFHQAGLPSPLRPLSLGNIVLKLTHFDFM